MMQTFEEFVATRVSGTDDDPLLAKHPNNPAMTMFGDVAYFSDEPPIRQYIYYRESDDSWMFIAEERSWKTNDIVFAMWWGQGGTECYPSLEEAEKALWDFG